MQPSVIFYSFFFFLSAWTNFFSSPGDSVFVSRASWHAARPVMCVVGGSQGPAEVAQRAARREETGPDLREAGSFLFEWGGYKEDDCPRAGYPLSEFTL